MAGRPKIFKAAEEMQAAIDAYFEKCTEDKRPFTVMGLALSLGMCRKTLCEYAKSGIFCNTVKRAKDIVEASVEERLMSGTNATGSIFWLKNNAGWKDEQHQRVTLDFSKLSDEELEAIAAGQSET